MNQRTTVEPSATTQSAVILQRATDASNASSADTFTLPPELLAEASIRLGWAGLIYAITYTFAYWGPHIVTWLTVPGYAFWRVQNIFAIASVSLGFAIFGLSRRATFAPQKFLDIGLVFQVVGSFGISVVEFWGGFPAVMLVDGKFTGAPWECVWIIIFPLLAPNSPRKVLIASLATASTGPIILAMRMAAGVDIGRTPLNAFAFFAFSTYLCVIVAYVIARIVYRYGVRLRKAREVGSYELLTKLGEGGMGEVWVGRHRMLARPAAVKLIRPDLLGNDTRSRETAIRRFEREAMATANLRSTHTIDVYDFGVTEDGAFYYVMEFLEGLTLDAMIRKFGPVSASRSIYLLKQACHSLGEAHARGLVHRDIKPANIFSSRLGPDCDFVKVLDFGLVKQRSADEASLTGAGVTAGTPAYMAPEIAMGRDEIDGRADIYALGCVAYWLLTGQPVFRGETPVATVLAHVRDAPVPPSQRTEIYIPPRLEQIILDCLAKDPAVRPQTTTELAARLSDIAVDPWTNEEARKWWALHGPMGTRSQMAGEERSAEAVVYAKR